MLRNARQGPVLFRADRVALLLHRQDEAQNAPPRLLRGREAPWPEHFTRSHVRTALCLSAALGQAWMKDAASCGPGGATRQMGNESAVPAEKPWSSDQRELVLVAVQLVHDQEWFNVRNFIGDQDSRRSWTVISQRLKSYVSDPFVYQAFFSVRRFKAVCKAYANRFRIIEMSLAENDRIKGIICQEEIPPCGSLAETAMTHYSETTFEYVRRVIDMHLSQANLEKAESLLNSNYRNKLKGEEILTLESMINQYKTQAFEKDTAKFKKRIIELLAEFKFEPASLIASERGFLNESWYRECEAAKRKEFAEYTKKKPALERIKRILSNSFIQADIHFFHQSTIVTEEYVPLKLRFATAFFSGKTEYDLSDAQLLSATHCFPDCLLAARAGSGKTGVLSARSAMLMTREHVDPDKILILAFNRKAAADILSRIRKQFGAIDFLNAKTFHGLAYALSPPKKKPLFDENEGGVSTKKQSQFIQELVKQAINPTFKSLMHEFFRAETKELENIGAFMSKAEYLSYRRAHRQITLRGDLVKSTGEKYIGDFLFEHGVKHRYEHIWYWPGEGNYQPDFSIFGNHEIPNVVVEHWGIDEFDSAKSAPEKWNMSWEQYHDSMERKRTFWAEYNHRNPGRPVTLIETSIADLRNGREAFELSLKEKLEDAGIKLERLADKDIFSRLEQVHIARITGMFIRFISLAQKGGISPEGIQSLIDSKSFPDERSRLFSELSNSIFRDYRQKLDLIRAVDFDGLVKSACQKIESTRGECSWRVADGRRCNLTDLKYIMIDEYQDVSKVFYELISLIKKFNPNVNIFCVGDDWQSINSFAGSNQKYFERFDDFFPESERRFLLSNYRSAASVVKASNSFMIGKGPPANAAAKNLGKLFMVYTDKVFIELRPGDEHEFRRELDKKFITVTTSEGITRNRDAGQTVARALKA